MIIELRVSYDTDTKQVGLSGPIDDRILCYGLLGFARDLILLKSMNVGSNDKKIVGVIGDIPPFLGIKK